MVVTTKPHVAKQCNLNYGCVPLCLPGAENMSEDKVTEQVGGSMLCHASVPFGRCAKHPVWRSFVTHKTQLLNP